MWSDELSLDPYSPPPVVGPDPIVIKVGEGNPLRKEDLDGMKEAIEAAPSKLDLRPTYKWPAAGPGPVTAEEIRQIVREELARVLRP